MFSSLAVEPIQLANLTQPRQCPLFQLRVAFSDSHKIATHVSPAEHQNKLACLDLFHGLVGTVAVDDQQTLSVCRKVSFRNFVAASGVEHIDDRVFSGEDPQPPAKAVLPLFFHENEPTCFIRVMESRL